MGFNMNETSEAEETADHVTLLRLFYFAIISYYHRNSKDHQLHSLSHTLTLTGVRWVRWFRWFSFFGLLRLGCWLHVASGLPEDAATGTPLAGGGGGFLQDHLQVV